MNIRDRIICLEVKLVYIQKLLYLIIFGMAGSFGIDYIPVVSAMVLP